MVRSVVSSRLTLLIALTLIWATYAVLAAGRVSGHAGGDPLVINQPAGPFFVSVWSLPKPLTTGEANFIVFVAEEIANGSQRANSPVLNASLALDLTSMTDGESILAEPTHRVATNKLFYESYFELFEPGDYMGTLTVEFDGRQGEISFPFLVEQAEVEINWFLYSTLASIILTVGWLMAQITNQEIGRGRRRS